MLLMAQVLRIYRTWIKDSISASEVVMESIIIVRVLQKDIVYSAEWYDIQTSYTLP